MIQKEILRAEKRHDSNPEPLQYYYGQKLLHLPLALVVNGAVNNRGPTIVDAVIESYITTREQIIRVLRRRATSNVTGDKALKSKPCLVGQLQPGSIWPLDFSVRNFLLRSFFSGLGGEDQLHEPLQRFRMNQFRKEVPEDLLISAGVALQIWQ